MKESKQIDFLQFLSNITKNWLVLIAGFVIGGLIGYLISMMLPPVYEASTEFLVTINYSETGALSDAQEDRAMRDVGLLFLSEEVVTNTISELENRNINLDKKTFLDNAYSEREGSLWRIRYRSKNKESIKQVLETWSSAADQVFMDSLQHALILKSEYDLLDSLINCIQTTNDNFIYEEICGFDNIQQINNEIEKLSEKIQTEKELSRGLFAFLSITKNESIVTGDTPIRFNRNVLVFCSSMIGFLFSAILSYHISGKRSQFA